MTAFFFCNEARFSYELPLGGGRRPADGRKTCTRWPGGGGLENAQWVRRKGKFLLREHLKAPKYSGSNCPGSNRGMEVRHTQGCGVKKLLVSVKHSLPVAG